jgi:hypothetical protein
MAKSILTKRDEERELTRRALIKWTVAAGAALGVSRAKVFDILEKVGGKDIFAANQPNATHRSVHLVAGNGGMAWFMTFWPHPDVAAANNPSFAVKPGSAPIAGTDNPLTSTVDTPWLSLPAARQVTAFVCGNNETHTRTPQSPTTINGNGIFAVASALQASSPSVIPIITIGGQSTGTAPGAQTPAAVNNGDGIVGLFNSAASRAGGLLANASDASLYKAHYAAFAQLNRASARSTQTSSYVTATGAAGFLGTNLAAQLAIAPADLTRYGVDGSTPTNVSDIAHALIVTVKAFHMGLTNSVVLPAMGDDPHDAWDSGRINTVPGQLKGVFEAFMNDLTSTQDSSTGVTLADDTVITWHGDTTKDAFSRPGWNDGTANNHNVVFCYSANELKSGWFGKVDRNQGVSGFDQNGALTAGAYNGTTEAKYALASIAYAIAKRDSRLISPFANGISIAPGIGRPKNI